MVGSRWQTGRVCPACCPDPDQKVMVDMRHPLAPRCLFLYNTVADTGANTAHVRDIQRRLEDGPD